MKIQEGNFILFNGDVTQITYNNIAYLSITQIQGIPITKDFLLNNGFKYTPCGISPADMWQGLGYWILQNDLFTLTLRGDKSCKQLRLNGFINSDIQYVHTLQNLYYILYQSELDLKI
jgi:hypothetical protein